MEKNELIRRCVKEYMLLPPDIAENIKENRVKLLDYIVRFKELAQTDKTLDKLSKLLEVKSHYFDKGFYDSRTPEQLDEEIRAELSTLSK